MSAYSPFWTAEQSRSNLGTTALQAQAQVGSLSADRVAAGESSIDELDAAICRLARHLNAETYRMLLLVRAFDDRMGWAKWSFRSCAEWLAWRCGLSLSAAREKVRTAQALREMPRICAAFAEGRLSYSKVRALTRVVQAHDEDLLLAYALQANAAQVEERCRQLRNATPESVGGAWRAWERRSLTLWRNDARNTMTISVEVPIDGGELIAQALERAVQAGEAAMGPEFAADVRAPAGARVNDPRGGGDSGSDSGGNGWRAQQADALIAIAKAYLTGGGRGNGAGTSASAADHCQVVVHVDDSALRGGPGRSDLPIDTVKRLTCDGSLITIVEDDNGTPLDVGRKRRTVSTPLKRALWSRDRGCSFPGCHHTRYVDAHHIHHWADGGDTSLANLTLLCSHHHTLLHEGRFTIRRDHDGALYFRRADGRVIPRLGYRLDDMCDDVGDDFTPTEKPSAEVRESAGVYSIGAAGGDERGACYC
jgi:hypothetical protein